MFIIEAEHLKGGQKEQKKRQLSPLILIIWVISEGVKNAGFSMDHLFWVKILTISARNNPLKASFMASNHQTRKFFIKLLKKATDAGEMNNSLNLEAVSICLYALADGLIARTADDTDG